MASDLSKIPRTSSSRAQESSAQAFLLFLRELDASAAALSTISLELATQIPPLRDQLRSGRLLSEVDALAAVVGSRAELNHAVAELHFNFRSVLALLYAAARAGGQSIDSIARTWGVSRPLVSRTLQQSARHDTAPSVAVAPRSA